MATTQAPQDRAAVPGAAPARPDETQSLKHHNQLLLANLNATRKALAEAKQSEQRSLQMYEQTQALLLEREQAAAAALAACQAQLSEAGAREQQLLTLLQQERDSTATSRNDAVADLQGPQLIARLDQLQQVLLAQLTQQEVPNAPDREALNAALQREQTLAVQVEQLQQALADKERALEAATVLQQMDAVLARGKALLSNLASVRLPDEQAADTAMHELQSGMQAVQSEVQSVQSGMQAVQSEVQSVQSGMQTVMAQALAKMDALLKAAVAQTQKLEELRTQVAPSKPETPPAAARSKFATADHFVLDLPSDLLSRTGTAASPSAPDLPPAAPDGSAVAG